MGRGTHFCSSSNSSPHHSGNCCVRARSPPDRVEDAQDVLLGSFRHAFPTQICTKPASIMVLATIDGSGIELRKSRVLFAFCGLPGRSRRCAATNSSLAAAWRLITRMLSGGADGPVELAEAREGN